MSSLYQGWSATLIDFSLTKNKLEGDSLLSVERLGLGYCARCNTKSHRFIVLEVVMVKSCS